jgi:starvation-inducible outer membrane lipoprotein
MKQPILTLLFLPMFFYLSCETTKKQTKSTSPEESQKITTVENERKTLQG